MRRALSYTTRSRANRVGNMRKLDFRIEDRKYYHHRPDGCTVVEIEHCDWPGNEFGLWLPESALSWKNWERAGQHQEWEIQSRDEAVWRHSEEGAKLVSGFKMDQDAGCLWYSNVFTNTSDSPLRGVTAQTCLHLVNAPEFISINGERIWVRLDGKWKTTDRVPREKSVDPNRIRFLRRGARKDRTVVHNKDFPFSTMPESACHPLIIAESFDREKSVGIACRDMAWLFNNNDYILRCIHSEPEPIKEIGPGEECPQEGIVIFCEGTHEDLLERYEQLVPAEWWVMKR